MVLAEFGAMGIIFLGLLIIVSAVLLPTLVALNIAKMCKELIKQTKMLEDMHLSLQQIARRVSRIEDIELEAIVKYLEKKGKKKSK